MKTGNEKFILNKLKPMQIEQARHAIASGDFGAIGSQDHAVASSWLAVKESDLRDIREAETLSIAKEANELARKVNLRTSDIDVFTRRAVRKDRIIAIVAIIIAAIAARADIAWFISWILSKIGAS
jgi:iron uptake system EfeUOB component EfeO/EfeM